MSEKPDLAALIGSRICHDLISPIGAIANGMELLALGGSAGPEIALISDSVANAGAKIRFFRVAFGIALPDQRISRTEVQAILADLERSGGRIRFDWQGDADLSRLAVKAAFLMILCLESAMPYGGEISFGPAAGEAVLTGRSARMKIDDGLWGRLSDAPGKADIGASEVHFALLAEEMRRQGRQARAGFAEGEIRITF